MSEFRDILTTMKWVTCAVALCGCSNGAIEGGGVKLDTAADRDTSRCLTGMDATNVSDREAYCAGLVPASRRARCTEHLMDSVAGRESWCADEWKVNTTAAALSRSALETDPNLKNGNCYYDESGQCVCIGSPILIDVNGDGFALTDAVDGVFFDLRMEGRAEQFAWTRQDSDDAWLVLDRNGNGVIDDGSEMFGDHTAQPTSSTPNGFTALAVFDEPSNGGNGDSQIDVKDSVYEKLRLWRDVNHDGISQVSELQELAKAGVNVVNLDYSVSKLVDPYGNAFRYVATVQAPPVGPLAYDVFLRGISAANAPSASIDSVSTLDDSTFGWSCEAKAVPVYDPPNPPPQYCIASGDHMRGGTSVGGSDVATATQSAMNQAILNSIYYSLDVGAQCRWDGGPTPWTSCQYRPTPPLCSDCWVCNVDCSSLGNGNCSKVTPRGVGMSEGSGSDSNFAAATAAQNDCRNRANAVVTIEGDQCHLGSIFPENCYYKPPSGGGGGGGGGCN